MNLRAAMRRPYHDRYFEIAEIDKRKRELALSFSFVIAQ
jgi:hypothetical protein